MGIFSKLFGSKPSHKYWMEISSNISKGLEHVRKEWFNRCVEILQERSSEEGYDIKIANTHLAGKVNLTIKAFQLCTVSSFLALHSYIPQSKGKDFADILYSQVCETDLEECLVILPHYCEYLASLFLPERRREGQIPQFPLDIARHITGKDFPITESILIALTIPTFITLNFIVVAICFGDEETAKKFESTLNGG